MLSNKVNYMAVAQVAIEILAKMKKVRYFTFFS